MRRALVRDCRKDTQFASEIPMELISLLPRFTLVWTFFKWSKMVSKYSTQEAKHFESFMAGALDGALGMLPESGEHDNAEAVKLAKKAAAAAVKAKQEALQAKARTMRFELVCLNRCLRRVRQRRKLRLVSQYAKDSRRKFSVETIALPSVAATREHAQESLADRIGGQAEQRAPNQLSNSQLKKHHKATAQAEYGRKRQYHKPQDFWDERRREEDRRRDSRHRDDRSLRRSRSPVQDMLKVRSEANKADKRDDRAEARSRAKPRSASFTGCFNCEEEGYQAKDCPEKKNVMKATKTRGV
ncbi:hypothetical protein SARC_05968 [Sphaeroforma arctica JP610]|uniref:CCHC-type domain-containing protein n=1 Tax=Sphaeroforma arctica JP610 TaxID=667725 RepID=A0A0L0FY30_9EUKA|nr:hypothetical protein SARC_05968 [Sphaeroforma arctica JP610]KNC81727.1 hypothetical protein SARC_05968 [Sphaeroforma arctica JP610]|eukprot:XP_014155629.1 hypothetical protein SARC_05968 [Sphaeroforma arctica JP610]